MSKSPIEIKIEKRQAAVIYVFLFAFALYAIFSLLSGPSLTTGILVIKVVYSIVALPISTYGIFTLFSKRFIYKAGITDSSTKAPLITITDKEIVCSFPSTNKSEKIRWDDIVRIQVLTTDEGPYVCDVFLLLLDANDKGVVIPQEKEEETKKILDVVLKYPGFDQRLFIEAMGHTQVKWFTVWEKK